MHSSDCSLTGSLSACYWLLSIWFIIMSFLVSVHCNTWVVYFTIAAVVVPTAYLALVAAVPSCVRPGGFLAFLRYGKLATVTRFGARDTALFGRLRIAHAILIFHTWLVFSMTTSIFPCFCLPRHFSVLLFTWQSLCLCMRCSFSFVICC
jgi:hypothetical protein